MRFLVLAVACISCGGTHTATPVVGPKPVTAADPTGPHREAVAAQCVPMIDAELTSGIVVGLYDGGRTEIYGFGKGPGGKPPTGSTLFEVGPVTGVFTSLLLADTVQHKLVELDTELSEFLPPGVTAPTVDKTAITLRHLAVNGSGLPTLPPSLEQAQTEDAFTKYNEDALFRDLVHTTLLAPPGQMIHTSSYGTAVLAWALGKKLGGFDAAVKTRILDPLGMHDTFFTVPAADNARYEQGTSDDLTPAPRVSVGLLHGALGLVTDAHDMLVLIDAELDAAAGSHQGLRPAMKLTQETQVESDAANLGLGWNVDSAGRYWQAGSTPGFRSFVGFDPKTRRGLVVLSATSISLTDGLARRLYDILEGKSVPTPKFADAAQLATFAGTYTVQGVQLTIKADGRRLELLGKPGEPPLRLLPISDHEFWIESQQVIVVFDSKDGKVTQAVFVQGEHQITAPRVN